MSARGSPFHSLVKVLIYSGEEPTFCAFIVKPLTTDAIKKTAFLFININVLNLLATINKSNLNLSERIGFYFIDCYFFWLYL